MFTFMHFNSDPFGCNIEMDIDEEKQVHLTLLYDLIYKALQTTLMDKMKPRDSLLQLASLAHQTPTWLNSSTLTAARESHVTLPKSL
ncbi:hypothetical protein NC653_035939 [Populus alba x Populus x berolinensis]|uniref:Uncharacterized protein n=1 Tax=Populus alba x Populus x berolinensis TaxID=444605 RepID=A0AAD6LIX5_9ROSI|nr:hypothetical protein NC653_035939 [Populus alba x Populus x berolinensis]